MRKDQKFEKPILTPSTKEEVGKHDEPISPRELVARGTITQKQWDEMARMTLDLFAAGQGWAKQRGLILVDTKLRVRRRRQRQALGHRRDPHRGLEPVLDCGRERGALQARRGQQMLDKEFFRQWLHPRAQLQGGRTAAGNPDEVARPAGGEVRGAGADAHRNGAEAPGGRHAARIEKALRTGKYLQGQ